MMEIENVSMDARFMTNVEGNFKKYKLKKIGKIFFSIKDVILRQRLTCNFNLQKVWRDQFKSGGSFLFLWHIFSLKL